MTLTRRRGPRAATPHGVVGEVGRDGANGSSTLVQLVTGRRADLTHLSTFKDSHRAAWQAKLSGTTHDRQQLYSTQVTRQARDWHGNKSLTSKHFVNDDAGHLSNTTTPTPTHVSGVVRIHHHLCSDHHAEWLEHCLDHLRRYVRLHVSDVDFGLRRGRCPGKRTRRRKRYNRRLFSVQSRHCGMSGLLPKPRKERGNEGFAVHTADKETTSKNNMGDHFATRTTLNYTKAYAAL